jgi:heme/copper-type cytochrome/quinol oxidase subunit 2
VGHFHYVLSMGAVFAIFAGFYYWIEKIVGLQYNNLLANLHFTLFFIGVNITFMPLHFLGISGHPRRVPDQADYYQGWNEIATLGSSISIIATLVFFYVIFDMFVYGVAGRKAPYSISILTEMRLSDLLLIKTKNNSIKLKKWSFFSFVTDAQIKNMDFQLGFQDPATPLMEGIIDLHHDIMFFLILVVVLISYFIFELVAGDPSNFLSDNLITFKKIQFGFSSDVLPTKVQHNTLLEIIWTIIPCVILFLIAIPSFSLLYAIEDLNIIETSIKIIGNQWYWTYELPSEKFEKIFDSVMIPEENLFLGRLRLLEVDNRLILPIEKQLRLLITASDVLHSWAVPSLGVKLDACPGRLNQIALWIKRSGVYYGQCSEICGINHGFMPIVVQAVEQENFLVSLLDVKLEN